MQQRLAQTSRAYTPCITPHPYGTSPHTPRAHAAYCLVRNVLDVVSITLMLVIIPFHLARFQTGPGDALAPMLAFEIVMTWFKVGASLRWLVTCLVSGLVVLLGWWHPCWCLTLSWPRSFFLTCSSLNPTSLHPHPLAP